MPLGILDGVVQKVKTTINDSTDVILLVAGAGGPAAVVEVVKSWLPEQTEGMADETVAMVIGFVIFYYGDRLHAKLPAFGLGIFLAAIGAWSAELVSGIIVMLKKAA